MDRYNMLVGPAAVRGPRYRFRNPAGPAVVAQSLIATSALADIGIIVSGGSDSPWVGDDGLPLLGLLQIACWISFLVWFHRCRCNAEVLAPGTHKYAPGFAVGAWAIPLAMWWLPRRITLDIRRAGGPPVDVWLINTWWFVWLCDGPLSVAVHLLLLHQTDYHNPVDHGIGVVSSVLAIAVIRRVTAGQPAGPLPYFNMT
ncbi:MULTISPECIES: DUF4328 domain-containing protein [Streptomyces]|uniref:DUF4328 domain-containing protein n=2 Tax=Streptomyces TaxID=1883 RepID=A0A2U9NUX2_STRAS|nr:DUF4328 domain-containing protein [Streptomyces actuosus]AWT41080.1 hypothetical protein DMT42_01185 [Streptomyces actuosus]MBM4826417.1 DUF4328 domain-containing protein [Streptomyces actuosus]